MRRFVAFIWATAVLFYIVGVLRGVEDIAPFLCPIYWETTKIKPQPSPPSDTENEKDYLDEVPEVVEEDTPEEGEERIRFVGTAFFVSSDIVITAAHVLPIPVWDEPPPPPDEVIIPKIRIGDKFYTLTPLLVAPQERDIAVCKVEGYESPKYLKVDYTLPKVLEKTRIYSFFPSRDIQDEYGAVPQPVVWEAKVANPNFAAKWGISTPTVVKMLLLRPAAWNGASGSPIIHRGKAIAVLVGIIPNASLLLAEPLATVKDSISPLLSRARKKEAQRGRQRR